MDELEVESFNRRISLHNFDGTQTISKKMALMK